MNPKDMQMPEIETRLSQIAEELKNPEADIDALTEEVNALEERKKELKMEAAEKRRADLAAVLSGADPSQTVADFGKLEGREMPRTNEEVRSSVEYGKAFLTALKSGDDEEARSLLTTQVSGQVPVPTFLETEIKTAWEESKLMGLVKHSNLKGNVQVGFELSATGASVHVEGTDAPTEEVVTIGVVELKAESIKKWITVSDEALEGTTVDTIGYLYKEIAHKIVEKAEEILVDKIVSSPATSTATAAGVPVLDMNPAIDTILVAEALLSAQARDLHIAMNRQTYPIFVKLALQAGYAIDVFDGLKDKIVYTDALKPLSTASVGDTYAIIGDFGYGFQANFPNGNELTLKVDDLSLAEKDLVKLVGRQYVGMGVVAPKSFVKLNKVNAG